MCSGGDGLQGGYLKRTWVVTGGNGGRGSVWNVVICPKVLAPDTHTQSVGHKTANNDCHPPLPGPRTQAEERWPLGVDGGRVKESGVSSGGGRRGGSSNVDGGGATGTGRGAGVGVGIAGELRLPEEEEEANMFFSFHFIETSVT